MTELQKGNIFMMRKFHRSGGAINRMQREAAGYVRAYATAAGLAADTSLAAGMLCQTVGYRETGDRGGALYVIEPEPYLWGSVTLANGLFANLTDHERVNAISLGFRCDGTDNAPVLEELMTVKRRNENQRVPLTLVFPTGDFVFSPVMCDTNSFRIEGSGIPNSRKGDHTRFLAAGDQEYILMFGRDDTQRYGADGKEWMYRGNGIRNIRFTTVKYDEDIKGWDLRDDNWYRISNAGLVISRQTMCEFDNIWFYLFAGTCISISASYEITFGTMYMYHILCLEKGALYFAYDIGNNRKNCISDNSALFFNYLALEAIAGDCITFDMLCDTYNTMFNVINYEDYRTSPHFGTEWTQGTGGSWLPNGYDEPDVVLAIFRFRERCTTDQTIVNQIQMQNMCYRTFMYEGKCYAKTALMAVDAYVYDASLNVGIADIRSISARAPFYPIYSPSPYTGQHAGLYVGRFITNTQDWVIRPYGYVRTCHVGYDHGNARDASYDARRSPDAPAYISVYDNTVISNYVDYYEREEIDTFSPYSTKMVGVYPAAGKGCEEALSWNKICAIPVLPKVFRNMKTPAAFGGYYIRIPLVGDLLHIRVKLERYDELICAVMGYDDSTIKVFNLREYKETGWQWLCLDMSKYRDMGYLTFGMRSGSESEPLLDVYYWEHK